MTAVLSGRIWCAYRSRALAAIALLTDLRVDHFPSVAVTRYGYLLW
jgi:hypothetical protein